MGKQSAIKIMGLHTTAITEMKPVIFLAIKKVKDGGIALGDPFGDSENILFGKGAEYH